MQEVERMVHAVVAVAIARDGLLMMHFPKRSTRMMHHFERAALWLCFAELVVVNVSANFFVLTIGIGNVAVAALWSCLKWQAPRQDSGRF